MPISLKLPSFFKLIPDNFKEFDESLKNLETLNVDLDSTLAGYKINPVLLTAWLLDVAQESYKHFDSTSMANFRRTRRMNDILFQKDVRMSSPEMYKGFLSFKGTWKDLIYVARLLNIKVELEEYNHSGLINNSIITKKFAQSETLGLYKFNNNKQEVEFDFQNPYNAVVYNARSKDSAAQFKFKNTTNEVKYGNPYDSSLKEEHLCGFQIVIDLNSAEGILDTMDILTKLSMMLINRLIPCARASIIYGNFLIDDIWDWKNKDRIDESIDYAFADDIREDLICAWKITHKSDSINRPIVLDGSRYIGNRIMVEKVFIQE